MKAWNHEAYCEDKGTGVDECAGECHRLGQTKEVSNGNVSAQCGHSIKYTEGISKGLVTLCPNAASGRKASIRNIDSG